MNLIELLGGYGNAKERLKRENLLTDSDFNHGQRKLLEYRRQHNIFEKGDWVVIESYRSTCISCGRPSQYSIGDLVFIHDFDGNIISDDDYNFIDYRDVRHATDEEIKAGKRLDVTK